MLRLRGISYHLAQTIIRQGFPLAPMAKSGVLLITPNFVKGA
jgi:hypothetical protein